VIGIWQGFGFAMVLFVSGLKAVPQQLYDAAAVDGADGVLDRLRIVTLPMLGPVTMFRRHPDGEAVVRGLRQRSRSDPGAGRTMRSEVLLHRLYTESFDFLHMGYGAALHRGLSRNHCAAYADTSATSRTAGPLLHDLPFPDRRFAGRVARQCDSDSHGSFCAVAIRLDGEPVAQNRRKRFFRPISIFGRRSFMGLRTIASR